MASRVVFLIATAFICKAQSQLCGCGAPSPVPCGTIPPQVAPLSPCVTQVAPSVVTSPAIATTIIDNTVSNSLANAIQLLIVSNLLENKLCPSAVSGPLASAFAPVFETFTTCAPMCNTGIEVIAPEFYPTQNIYGCDNPIIEPFVPNCFQEIVPFGPNMCNNFPDFGPNICNNCPDLPVPTFGLGPCMPECPNNPFFGPTFGPGPFGGMEPFGCPFPGPAFPGFVEPNPLGTLSPVAAEVLFPSSIPAQLTCNFGYMPTNVPCVSVNVEPLPFEPCNNLFGNGNGFYY